MRDIIVPGLAEIEAMHGVKIIHAVESGSRVWGFHSPDSDYDVRFIYVRPLAQYVTVDEQRDVIEIPIDGDLDYSGWDLSKTLGLLRKSNPPLLEWLSSPVTYKTTETADALRKLSIPYVNPRSLIYHYLHMANGNYRAYLQGEEVWLKKYLYVVRPLLCCRYIEKHNKMPPVVMQDMVDLETNIPKEAIKELLKQKMAGAELSYGKAIPELNVFIEEQLKHYLAIVKTTPKVDHPPSNLDAFLFNTVMSVTKGTFK